MFVCECVCVDVCLVWVHVFGPESGANVGGCVCACVWLCLSVHVCVCVLPRKPARGVGVVEGRVGYGSHVFVVELAVAAHLHKTCRERENTCCTRGKNTHTHAHTSHTRTHNLTDTHTHLAHTHTHTLTDNGESGCPAHHDERLERVCVDDSGQTT